MRKVRYFFEYKLLWLIGALMRILPRRAVLFLGARAGDFIYYCVPVRKKITLENLRSAFPDTSEKDIRVAARQAYRNLAMNGLEHLCISALKKEDLLRIVDLENEDVMQRAFAAGKGVIFIGGHFGNWEYMGGAVLAKGYPLTYVVAGIANPYIDEMVNNHRRKMGAEILYKGVSIRSVLRTLRGNGGMVMLMDQDAGRNGVFVNFFNKPCSAPRGPALFALKTGAAMVFVSSVRQKEGRITAVFEEVEIDYQRGPSEENIHAVMQRGTTLLEKYVRRYPGQWFWFHRRWKTRPQ